MTNVLVGVDEAWRARLKAVLEPLLAEHGFSAQYCSPVSQVPASIELIAEMDGKVDLVLLYDPPLAGIGGVSTELPTGLAAAVATATAIRDMPDGLAFLRTVKANTVPVLAFTNKTGLAEWPDLRWCRFAESTAPSQIGVRVYDDLVETANQWQASVLDELENVGHAVTRDLLGNLTISPVLHRKRGEGVILTPEATPGALRKGHFLILSQDLIDQFEPYHKLQFLLDHFEEIAKAEGIQPETVFQRFFEENPQFILRDQFDQNFPKPRLPIAGKENFLVPDFVQRPRAASSVGTKWGILDVKRPDARLSVGHAFHADASAALYHAIRQLRDYRDYFNREENAEELIKRFGLQPVNPKLAVLIGRRDRMDHTAALDHALGPTNLDIEVVSYDEILEIEGRRLGLLESMLELLG